MTSVSDPRGKPTNFEYDDRNRQVKITDALGYITKTDLDAAGNKTKVTRDFGGPLASVTQYPLYDAMNRLQREIDPTGAITQWSYDGAGNVLASTDANYQVYSYAYDKLNRRKMMTYPAADANTAPTSEAWTYDITGTGNLVTYKNRKGDVQTYAPYDNRNRVTSFTWSDGTQGQSSSYEE